MTLIPPHLLNLAIPVLVPVALGLIAAPFVGVNPFKLLAGMMMTGAMIVLIAACG